MDGPSSSDASEGDANEPTPREQTPEGDQEDEESRFPMPSPWAAAFAVIALLAFGVGLGVYVRPHESSPVLLAASPSETTSSTTTTSTSSDEGEGESGAESKPEEESSSGGSEGEEESKGSEASSKEGSGGKEATGGKGSEGEEGSKGKGSEGSSGAKTESKLPPIKHVFVVVLGEQGYEATYGVASKAPYLATTLREQGELIGDYFGVASGQLANEIALVSGQGPTPQTGSNCPVYEALSPGKSGSEGQVLGTGCVYPSSALTVGDQLLAAEDTWKAYIQGLDEGSSGSLQGKCPSPTLGAGDPFSAPTGADPFVTWRDPFLYFRSVTSNPSCAEENVGIGQLSKDLASASTTPSLSYIAADPCEDGDAGACGSGPPGAEAFLRKVVPEIESSAAYKEGGMIAITFDQAPQSGTGADDSGCCATPKYPNIPASATTTATGEPIGGGRLGLLLISKYVKPNSSYVTGQYNHYSLLASIEALFKLQPLGYAGNVQLPAFEKAVYNAYS